MGRLEILSVLIILSAFFISYVFAAEVIEYKGPQAGAKALQDKSEGHTQGVPVAVSSGLVDKNIGFGTSRSRWNSLGINFFKGFKVSSGSNNLNVRDEVCVGDTLNTENLPLEAEWFSKGGPHDSPPVLFVEDLKKVVDQIETGTYKTGTYGTFVCAYYNAGNIHVPPDNCVVKAQVICEAKCSFASEGVEKVGNKFIVRKAGNIQIHTKCKPKCIIFVDRPAGEYAITGFKGQTLTLESAYGYMAFCGFDKDKAVCPLSGEFADVENAVEKYKSGLGTGSLPAEQSIAPEIYKNFTLSARPNTKGPKIMLKPHLPEEPSSRFIARLEIENVGDTGAYPENIKVSNADFKVLYSPEKIEPGKVSELLLEIVPDGRGKLDFSMDYSAETLGCFENRDFSASLNLMAGEGISGGCTADGDCPSGEACCAGTCRDSRSGVCDDIDGDGEPDTWVEV
jgi:hypothetical protein